MLPSLARADEFDLMAKFGKLGDRQRRDDERNLFLDLLLSARDRLLIAYTGRSIRDNAALPPAALASGLPDLFSIPGLLLVGSIAGACVAGSYVRRMGALALGGGGACSHGLDSGLPDLRKAQ